MKRFNTFLKVTMLISAGVLFAGCETFQTGDESSVVPQVTYSFGTLKTSEVIPFDRAWIATAQAMDDLQFTIKTSEKDPLQAELTALGEGREIHIHLEETSITSTEIRIRVGTMGNKELSQRVLKAIERHL